MLYKFSDFISEDKLNLLAKQTGFQKRTPKKITAYNFIFSFLNVYSSRFFSLRNWAQELSLISKQLVSYQALHKKLTVRHLPFLKEVFSIIIAKSIISEQTFSTQCISIFNRVLVEDSTCVKLSDSMFDHFSGASNGKTVKPIARIQVCLDLKNGKFEHVDITTYSKNDASYSNNILDRLTPKDLIIRDLGYWKTEVLCSIHQKGAYFISKLKSRTKIKDIDGFSFDLLNYLKGLDKQNKTEFNFVGQLNIKGHMPVKFVGRKVSKLEYQHRLQQSKKNRHKGSTIHPKTQYLLSWEIYVTNLIDDELTNEEIKKLYQLRWKIEMYFKNWKSNHKVQDLLKSSKGRDPIKPEILMYLSLIYMASIYQPNYKRARKIISDKYKKIISPLKFGEFLKSVFKVNIPTDSFIEHLEKYCCYDSRKDRINMQMKLECFGLG